MPCDYYFLESPQKNSGIKMRRVKSKKYNTINNRWLNLICFFRPRDSVTTKQDFD